MLSSNVRKLLVLIGLTALVALVIAGCAGTPTANPTAAVAPTSAPANTTAPQPQATTAPANTTAPQVQPTSAPAATTAPTVAPTAAPKAGPKVLRVNIGTYPDVLDPQRSSFGIEIAVLQLAYEGLAYLDNKGQVGPGAADKWTSTPDGKSMTFHIREGLKRADGTAMNASDYEFALKREVDPNLKDKQYTSNVEMIAGATALIDLEGKPPAKADLDKLYAAYGVKADDSKRELTITFANPVGYWNYIAYTWVTYPTDPKGVAKDQDNWWSTAANHNGNGPYKITKIDPSKVIVFEANPNYWRGKPKLDRIEFYYVTDEVQQFEAYKKGEFDVALVTSSVLDQAKGDALKAEFIRFPSATTISFAFNNAKKPFDQLNVRKAFSAAFNRDGYINDVLKGIGKPYTRWIPPGVPGSQPDKPGVPGYDPKAAVKFLTDNGFAAADSTADKPKVDCAKLGDIKLTYPGTAANHPRYQYLAGNLVGVFNCPVTLDPVDPTVLTAMTKKVETNPALSRQGWIQDYPHPQNWLSIYWTCNAFAKRRAYCNKDLDALLAKADATVDFNESIKLYQQAEDMLIKDVPDAFFNYTENLYMVKPYVIGVKENTGSSDATWPGEYGPVWTYDIDLSKVGPSYPTK